LVGVEQGASGRRYGRRNDDAKDGGYRRVEILTGPGRRRKWSDADKARIVAETLEPGAVVAEVARRRQVCPQQVFTWRREMHTGSAARLNFVPIVPSTSLPLPEPTAAPACSSPPIEVEAAGAVLRVAPGTDAGLLTDGAARDPGLGGMIAPPAGRGSCWPRSPSTSARARTAWLRWRPRCWALIPSRARCWCPLAPGRPDQDPDLGRSGLVLVWKQLEGGAFRWPAIVDGVASSDAGGALALFDGIDWRRVGREGDSHASAPA
jgi:transposase